MHRFSNDREALDFIASQIADQAQRDAVPLSEVERKMLYFSETASTLPDILEVSDEFDRDYDQGAYEKKISQLIKKAVSSARKQQDQRFKEWAEAIRLLSKEDRFLLVMVRQARLGAAFRPRRVLWRLWGTVVVGLTFFVALDWVIRKTFPIPGGFSYPRGNGPEGWYLWAAMVCVALIYGLLRFFVGARKFDETEDRALEWIFGMSKHRK
jgi:hypothetical protein